jgi:hypothetical protein
MKLLHFRKKWLDQVFPDQQYMLLEPTIENPLNQLHVAEDSVFKPLLFTSTVTKDNAIYCHSDLKIKPMMETMEHRVIRSKNKLRVVHDTKAKDVFHRPEQKESHIDGLAMLPQFPHVERPPVVFSIFPTKMPQSAYGLLSKVITSGRKQ